MSLVTTVLAWLPGCDPARVAKLEEGVSTEAQVRQQFGEPATVVQHSDGSKSLEYPRQPEGWTNYDIRIGPDGVLVSLRQLLHADNFARVLPGMDRSAVRDLLGRPAEVKTWALKNEEVWSWRFKPVNESRLFSVTFALPAGAVVATSTADDPRETLPQQGH